MSSANHGDSAPATAAASSPSRPTWLRVRYSAGKQLTETRELVRDLSLHTVCEEAHCPNLGECWGNGTATFMILGGICTRGCHFCAVTPGVPSPVDADEPRRVAEAVSRMRLKHAVITSVTRDDLADGGSSIFAETIRRIRGASASTTIEVLIPDFQGVESDLKTVVLAKPDVLNHNLETVERLQPFVRVKASYERSLTVLRRSRQLASDVRTKSGLMVGLGETGDEVRQALRDLRSAGCGMVTIGQYLRPSPRHYPMDRYYTPAEFAELREFCLEIGFSHVESAPLVRSSYHAHEGMASNADRDV